VFAYLRLAAKPNKAQDAAVTAIEKAGHPVVRITLPNVYALGQEFFRWEIATAVAGSIMGINAFNQPDVEASKIETKKLTSEYEAQGSLPPELPFLASKEAKLFADEKNSAALCGGKSLGDVVKTHLSRIGTGDYFAVLGYIPTRFAMRKKLLPAWALAHASCTRPAKPTKAVQTPAFFFRLPATIRAISPFPAKATPSAS
jgi:transaldolase/glucose-6-phosphate isomerase